MLKKLILLVGALTYAAPASAVDYLAPTIGTPTIKSTLQTVLSVGLQWDFGDSRPDFVASIRRTQTNNTSRVIGSKVDLAVPLTVDDGFQPRIRALALGGNRAAQGEAGFGFRVNSNSIAPLIGAGVQFPYANGGTNYVFRDGWKPYFGVNTLPRAAAPTIVKGPLSCASGTLVNAPANPDETTVVDGKTCQQ